MWLDLPCSSSEGRARAEWRNQSVLTTVESMSERKCNWAAEAFPCDIVDVMSEFDLNDDGNGKESPCYVLADNRRHQ